MNRFEGYVAGVEQNQPQATPDQLISRFEGLVNRLEHAASNGGTPSQGSTSV